MNITEATLLRHAREDSKAISSVLIESAADYSRDALRDLIRITENNLRMMQILQRAIHEDTK
jgi:hypothetical protein